MGGPEIHAFLSYLANERAVSSGVGINASSSAVLGHADVSTTMVYAHVLNKGGRGVSSPIDLPSPC
jgi:site-specific recombinase XerD